MKTTPLLFTLSAVAMLLLIAAPSGGSTESPLRLAQAQADVRLQLRTAIQHAGFAAEGDALGFARLHLGHTLNCIEGTSGKNFDRAWGHVCQGQGNGIAADLRSTPGGAPYRTIIEHADALAASGVAGRDLAETKAVAKAVRALLTVIADGLK
jgi:hypothetical protein